MAKFRWQKTISLNVLFLKFAGLWPPGVDGYHFDSYTFYSIALSIFVNGNNVFQTAYIYFIYTDLQALTAIFFVLVTDWLATIKICCFIKNARTLQHLMRELDSEEFQPRAERQWDLVQNTLSSWTIIYVAFFLAAITDLTLLSTFPVMDGSIKESRLPFWAWYPYNTRSSPMYELTYAYQVVCLWILAITNLNMDTMIAALMMYVVTQCEILCDNLKHIKNDNNGYNCNLLNCIKHHKKILRFAQNSNQFFNVIVFGQFFTSGAALALAMFQLTLVDPLSSECISLLFYVSSMTVQIFIYCWFGNEVEVRVFKAEFTSLNGCRFVLKWLFD